MKLNSNDAKHERGFTVTQMVITISIIAVISTFGVLGIKTARAEFRLQSAARLFASYIEKARADSIRRQATPGDESSVEIFGEGTTGYAITMDFGNGVETRTFELEPGIEFGTAAQKVSFDWRGRLTQPCTFTRSCVFQVRSVYLQQNLPVDVSGSGDITVGEQRFPDRLIPEVAISEVTNDVDNSTPIPTPTPSPSPQGTPPVEDSPDPEDDPEPTPTPSPTPTPNGNGNGSGNDGAPGNGDNGNPNGNPTPSPTPSVSPSPGTPQCTSTISPSELLLSQSEENHQTGTATFSMTNATGVRIISVSQAGNGNSLTLGLSLERIDGPGSSVITVTTKPGAGNRGVFVVQVAASPGCGSTQKLTVTVSN